MLTVFAYSQQQRFIFYNTENLFHPDVDSLNPDLEFTPDGVYQWTYYSYLERLHLLSKVIIALSDSNYNLPSVIGLAEIESRTVLQDLIGKTALRKRPYQLVHYDSPDRRGIDVGLIYNKEQFRLLHSDLIPFQCQEWPHYKSRDMLHVQLEAQDASVLNFIICHWPSRYGGKEKSAGKRLCASQELKNYTRNLQGAIIIMGDFNDEPQDESMMELCRDGSRRQFINLMEQASSLKGSHRYKGEWAYLDQILVDSTHFEGIIDCDVFDAPFLLEAESAYPGHKPKRAFRSKFYRGGFSDHLPIFLDWKL